MTETINYRTEIHKYVKQNKQQQQQKGTIVQKLGTPRKQIFVDLLRWTNGFASSNITVVYSSYN